MLKNFFWKILTSGLDGLVTFGLVAFATLLKLGVLSGRAERFLHIKFHQNPGSEMKKLHLLDLCYGILSSNFARPKRLIKISQSQTVLTRFIFWPQQLN